MLIGLGLGVGVITTAFIRFRAGVGVGVVTAIVFTFRRVGVGVGVGVGVACIVATERSNGDRTHNVSALVNEAFIRSGLFALRGHRFLFYGHAVCTGRLATPPSWPGADHLKVALAVLP